MTVAKRPEPGAAPLKSAMAEAHRGGTYAERYAAGKALRVKCPRASHAEWKVPKDRTDAVQTVLDAESGRLSELLPLRHGRMVKSAFTFYRGSALAMAHARSGNAAMLSRYMGKSDVFDEAIAAFSVVYADQNERDHSALDRAVRKGKVKAVFEEEK